MLKWKKVEDRCIDRKFEEKKIMFYCVIRNTGWNYLRYLTLLYTVV